MHVALLPYHLASYTKSHLPCRANRSTLSYLLLLKRRSISARNLHFQKVQRRN
nr:MAG TPA: hypothetical protein [Caudoviricetes sp.]